jgi:hypothetical protein
MASIENSLPMAGRAILTEEAINGAAKETMIVMVKTAFLGIVVIIKEAGQI